MRTITLAQLEALRLLAKSNDWTWMSRWTGIQRGRFTVNQIVARSLSKRGWVEKQDSRVRINETGRKILEAWYDR